MMREGQRVGGITQEEGREYILDILQELAQLARRAGDGASEEALTLCWQKIWRTERI